MYTEQARQSNSWVFFVREYLKYKLDLSNYQVVSLSSTGPEENHKELTFLVGGSAKDVSQLFEVYLNESQKSGRGTYSNQTNTGHHCSLG